MAVHGLGLGVRVATMAHGRATSNIEGTLTSCMVQGTVRYVGHVKFAEGVWVGIQLDPQWASWARNDGSVQGIVYFDTMGRHLGLFVKDSAVTVVEETRESLIDELEQLHAQLEMERVEREVVIGEKEILEAELRELKLELAVFKDVKDEIGVRPISSAAPLEVEKLQRELELSKHEADARENSLNASVSRLKEELSDCYTTQSDLENRLETALQELEVAHSKAQELESYAVSLQPDATTAMIEKLSMELSDRQRELADMAKLVTEAQRKEKEALQLENEFSSTFESLNELVTDLNEQLTAETHKCSALESRLLASGEIIKSLKMRADTKTSDPTTEWIFKGLARSIDARIEQTIKTDLPPSSFSTVKALVNVLEIGLVMEKALESEKWEELVVTCEAYLEATIHGLKELPLQAISRFMDSFWVLCEDSRCIELIDQIDVPFHWKDTYSPILNLSKLVLVTSQSWVWDMYLGVNANSYLEDIISSWTKKEIEVEWDKLDMIRPQVETRKVPAVPEPAPATDISELLRHKITVLESKLQNENILQQELHELTNTLDTKQSESEKLENSLAAIERLQIETQTNYRNAKALLDKFAINPAEHETIDELDVIDKMDLMNRLETQRELIASMEPKLAPFEDPDGFEWLREWPSAPKPSSRYAKMVNTMFDVAVVPRAQLEQSVLAFLSL